MTMNKKIKKINTLVSQLENEVQKICTDAKCKSESEKSTKKSKSKKLQIIENT